MKYAKQLAIIIAISFVGEILNRVIPLPVPAGIYGILILFFLLQSKILPVTAVEGAGDFLIDILPLMFIQPSVGILDNWDGIKGSLLALFAISIVSTVAVIGAAGWVTQLIIRRKGNREGNGQ